VAINKELNINIGQYTWRRNCQCSFEEVWTPLECANAKSLSI